MALIDVTKRQNSNCTVKAVAAGTSGALGGAVGSAVTLILCASPVSAPVIIAATVLGAVVGMYFGKDAESITGALTKGLVAGVITGAAVALINVAWNKWFKSMKSLTKRRKLKIKGKKRNVKISEGPGGKKGVTIEIKTTDCEIKGQDGERTPVDEILKPQHAYFKATDNSTGHTEKWELTVGDDGVKHPTIDIDMAEDESSYKSKGFGATLAEYTIEGTGKGAKRTNKYLFKSAKKLIEEVAIKSYTGEPYDVVTRSCQTFVSDGINAVIGGVAQHYANPRIINAARTGLSILSKAKSIVSVIANIASWFF